ncbi:putative DTW domain-containing protein DTWD2/YfiP [Helianthus annuus]|nr:putative DTW domain-containing protein DTWD2/YfiP [Helianthus annuus]
MLSTFGPINPLFTIFKPLKTPTQTLTLTLAMATLSGPDNRRPTCPSCSKPTRVCFCNRFKTPVLDNSIAVTLLQHRLEKKHPLNSAKIATLGLKNVNLAYVSDVVSQAHFDIHFLDSNLDMGHQDLVENHKKIQPLHLFDSNLDMGHQDSVEIHKKIQSLHLFDSNLDMGHQDSVEIHKKIQPLHLFDSNLDRGHQDSLENHKKIQPLRPADISFTVKRRGVSNQDFDELLVDQSCLNNGFVVTKIQKEIDGNNIEEFKIVVPPGSMLLFPSEKSIGIEDVDFNVKNLIVLDGTWAKALRMYKENPWLRLLPHVKLEVDKLSLYGEVRRQPKARCLSSIESIVYALKAIGKDDHQGLDSLLDVFESMVVDQRRCMNERLNLESSI